MSSCLWDSKIGIGRNFWYRNNKSITKQLRVIRHIFTDGLLRAFMQQLNRQSYKIKYIDFWMYVSIEVKQLLEYEVTKS